MIDEEEETGHLPRWPSGAIVQDTELTPQQWASVAAIVLRWTLPEPITIIPGLDYIMVQATPGLFLGIEKDGHVHS